MKTSQELEEIRKITYEKIRTDKDRKVPRVLVGMATCGLAAGARPVYETILAEVEKNGLTDVIVSQTGCIGMCRLEPIVEIYMPGEGRISYIRVDSEKAARIVVEHLKNGKPVEEYTVNSEFSI